jgi:hypothetical protein
MLVHIVHRFKPWTMQSKLYVFSQHAERIGQSKIMFWMPLRIRRRRTCATYIVCFRVAHIVGSCTRRK